MKRKNVGPTVPPAITAGALVDVWAPDEWAALNGAVQPPETDLAELAVQARITAQRNFALALQSWMRENDIKRRPAGITTIPKWPNTDKGD
ncbi:hypothetical protein D1O33_00465 [Rhodococcus rhodochrous]|nr:hypothetical protein D1O33_00465 [Rhodococcus rhodochrous]